MSSTVTDPRYMAAQDALNSRMKGALHMILVSGRRMGKGHVMARVLGPVMSRADYDEQLHQTMVRERFRCDCCRGTGKQTVRFHLRDHQLPGRVIDCPQCNGTGVDEPGRGDVLTLTDIDRMRAALDRLPL